MATISSFLFERLSNVQVGHVFVSENDLSHQILSFSSQEKVYCGNPVIAGYAADAYSRLKGMGCVIFGNKHFANMSLTPFSCANRENSPTLFVGINPDDSSEQMSLFSKISEMCVCLNDIDSAGYQIDRLFSFIKKNKKPVYIEIPTSFVNKPIRYDPFTRGTPTPAKSDNDALQEALIEIKEWIKEAHDPIILAGIEMARHSFGKQLAEWAKKSNIPIATTLLAKGLLSETSEFSAGIFSEYVLNSNLQKRIQSSDCLLVLGVIPNEVKDCSFFKKRSTVIASGSELLIKNHVFHNVFLCDFIKELLSEPIHRPEYHVVENATQYKCDKIKMIDTLLDDKSLVVSDCESLDISLQISSKGESKFICNSLYQSPFFSIGGAIGVSKVYNERIVVVMQENTFLTHMQDIENLVKKSNLFLFLIKSSNVSKIENILNACGINLCSNSETIHAAMKKKESFAVLV